MAVFVRGAIALAGALAVLAASGCGGGGTRPIGNSATTEPSTVESTTLSVPTEVVVMGPGGQRLVTPDEFAFKVHALVVGRHLRWTDWGKPAATAEGVFSERGFSSSNRVRFRTTLRLTELRVCGGVEYYTRAAAPLPSSGPFKATVNRLPTPCG